MPINVLLVGESWVSSSTHFKGFDFFVSANYEIGSQHLTAALENSGVTVKHLPAHDAARYFPVTVDDLKAYHVVILSDIGANTLLLHPDTFLHGRRTPNRLKVIADYVHAGGGLLMAGGYLSFQGIYLGYNEVEAKEGGRVLLRVADDPLLVVVTAGAGRTAAWTSDIGPHWCPPDFVGWDGYAAMFSQLMMWLANASE